MDLPTIHFVTSNNGKFKEVEAKLAPLGFEVVQERHDYPEVQADNLDDVAMFGMEYLKEVGMAEFIIEDSGLFIEPLGGFPGIYSSYILKTLCNPGILRLLGDRKDRGAIFRSCFGHFSTAHGPALIKGECKGSISFEQRGKGGFGFDPIFIPDGEERTFAEMSVEEKNSMSHRGRALEALFKHLQGR